jgi:hypothetical protein
MIIRIIDLIKRVTVFLAFTISVFSVLMTYHLVNEIFSMNAYIRVTEYWVGFTNIFFWFFCVHVFFISVKKVIKELS